jgi:hypothetical protein
MEAGLVNNIFGCCSLCGKRLVKFGPTGELIYIFGDNLEGEKGPIVNMVVIGSVRIQCTRKSCRNQFPRHWNLFHWDVFKNAGVTIPCRTSQAKPEINVNPANNSQKVS